MAQKYYPERVERLFELAQLPTIQSFLRDFTNTFNDVIPAQGFNKATGLTGITVYENKKQNVYVVEAQLPGLSQNEIQLTFENGILTIQGEKKVEESKTSDVEYFSRALNTTFYYQTSLPRGEIDDKQEPQAVYKDGVLKITFQKIKQNQAKKITIKGS